MSRTVKRRLLSYLKRFRAGQHVRERWTFYPANQPRTVLCTCGIGLDGGRMAMLVEGSIDEAVDEDALRSLEAVRHTSVMISLYAEDGRWFATRQPIPPSQTTSAASLSISPRYRAAQGTCLFSRPGDHAPPSSRWSPATGGVGISSMRGAVAIR